jgi:hypothetical protein
MLCALFCMVSNIMIFGEKKFPRGPQLSDGILRGTENCLCFAVQIRSHDEIARACPRLFLLPHAPCENERRKSDIASNIMNIRIFKDTCQFLRK